jgi:S-adenosylmethionine:tRNA ribosyltransferase-isomerase
VDLSLFDFELPPHLIADAPAKERDLSRLLVLDRGAGSLAHHVFRDLPRFLRAGDVLVLNETAVFPARLLGKRAATGGKAEAFLLEEREPGLWEALVRTKGTLREGEALAFGEGGARFEVIFERRLDEGRALVRFPAGADARVLVERVGKTPLPPYIAREESDSRESEDRTRYQTVYAREPGAVAAPTAGLHFTEPLLRELETGGVQLARLVLHVGLGTFAPVRAARVEEHRMHRERYTIPSRTIEAVEAARREGRRVVACGTTSVRALETWRRSGRSSGDTDIFIYPGYEFSAVDALITNFHLPRSTLLMLVSAFAGRERILAAYSEAIRSSYRFYSYGDAMLIV